MRKLKCPPLVDLCLFILSKLLIYFCGLNYFYILMYTILLSTRATCSFLHMIILFHHLIFVLSSSEHLLYTISAYRNYTLTIQGPLPTLPLPWSFPLILKSMWVLLYHWILLCIIVNILSYSSLPLQTRL